MKSRIFIFILVFATATAHAQVGREKDMEMRELWKQTQNAAGLALDSTADHGLSYFDGRHTSGNFARVQDGTQTNQLRFFTERKQKIGNYLYGYGRFDFDYGRTKNRAWGDCLRPHNSNPYFSASSIPGKYDFQDFDFTAALGTIDFGGWHFGARLDYKAGDFSRLRDPRSRNKLLDYTLTPALTYTVQRHTIGLSGHYRRRKEKLVGLTTVQNDPNLLYYLLSGMEHAEGTVGGYSSFNREWVDHRFGAQLDYAYRAPRLTSLTSLSIERGEEQALGLYKYEPGRYFSYVYGFQEQLRVIHNDRLASNVQLQATYEQAYADEYKMQLLQEKDSATGFTSYSYDRLIAFKKRYQVNVLNAAFDYRLTFGRHDCATGYVGMGANFEDVKNKHLMPLSELRYGRLTGALKGGISLLTGRLWAEGEAHYSHATKSTLQLADATTDYAQGVLLPDMNVLSADYWRASLAVTYSFRLSLFKRPSTWFVRAYGDLLKADHSLDRKQVGLTVGLFN